MANGDCVTQQKLDDKANFIYRDVKNDFAIVNKRIDKYADKVDETSKDMNEIKVSLATIIGHQESDRVSNTRILDLLTDRVKENQDDIKETRKRITFFSGAVAGLAFLFTYLWDALKRG